MAAPTYLGEEWPHSPPVQTTLPNKTGLDDRTIRSEDIVANTGVVAPLPVTLGERDGAVIPDWVGPKVDTDIFGLPLNP